MSADALKWWTKIKLNGVFNMKPNDYRVMGTLAYQHHTTDSHRMDFTKTFLARLCNMDRRSLNRSVDRLEKNGWIALENYPKGYARHYVIPRFNEHLERLSSADEVAF